LSADRPFLPERFVTDCFTTVLTVCLRATDRLPFMVHHFLRRTIETVRQSGTEPLRR